MTTATRFDWDAPILEDACGNCGADLDWRGGLATCKQCEYEYEVRSGSGLVTAWDGDGCLVQV